MSNEPRKITASLYVTLDGGFEAPEQWHFPYHNEEFLQALNDDVAASDTMLLGRRTYEIFAAHWPHQGSEVPMADQMNNTPKFVVSNTLTDPVWQNTTVIKGNVTEQLRDLKARPGKNLSVTGSATLVNYLMGEGLLDELTLLLHPLVLGNTTRRAFGGLAHRIPLELATVNRFKTDILRLTYAKAA